MRYYIKQDLASSYNYLTILHFYNYHQHFSSLLCKCFLSDEFK